MHVHRDNISGAFGNQHRQVIKYVHNDPITDFRILIFLLKAIQIMSSNFT